MASIDFDIGSGIQRRTGRNAFKKSGPNGKGTETEPLIASESESSKKTSKTLMWALIIFCTVSCLVVSGLLIWQLSKTSGDGDDLIDDDDSSSISDSSTSNTTFVEDDDDSSSSSDTTSAAITSTILAITTAAPGTPAPASEPSGLLPIPIELSFLCNVRFQNGTCRAVFGYDNPSDAFVTIPVGANNFIEPGPPNRGQREVFKPGFHFGGATFLWNCNIHVQARWTLRSGVQGDASVAIAPNASVTCPPVPISSGGGGGGLKRRKII